MNRQVVNQQAVNQRAVNRYVVDRESVNQMCQETVPGNCHMNPEYGPAQ